MYPYLRDEHTSGVLSDVAKPVPPVVKIKLMPFVVQILSASWILFRSSGTILVSAKSQFPPPSCSRTFFRISADASVLGSLAAVVETMRIATFNFDDMMNQRQI